MPTTSERITDGMSQTIEKYLPRLRETTSRPGVYAYRGQENADWPLHSGATRRLVKAIGPEIPQYPNFLQTYVSYHRETLLEPARTQGFGIEGGRTLSDLQLLAKLQHFGAATGLLDFTWDPMLALWFACLDNRQDGKLFVVNTNSTIELSKISSDESEHSLERIFSRAGNSPSLSYWEPTSSGDAMARILRQRSVFILGRPLIPDNPSVVEEVRISKEDKPALLRDLRLLDTSLTSIFQDVHGFSQAEGAESPIQEIREPQGHLIQGNRSYQDGNYSNAIRSYSEFINRVPEIGESYFLRGNAKASSGLFAAAICDYDEAINYKDRAYVGWDFPRVSPFGPWALFTVYHNRGNAKESLSDLEGALCDYSESIGLSPETPAPLFNRGNVLMDMGRLPESLDDYNQVIALGHDGALFNKGNALVMLGRFDEAMECYRELEQLDVDADGVAQNRITLQEVMDRIGDRTYEVRPVSAFSPGGMVGFALSIHGDDTEDSWNRIFQGRKGNIGNYGWNLPGGKGHKGKLGFILKVESERPRVSRSGT